MEVLRVLRLSHISRQHRPEFEEVPLGLSTTERSSTGVAFRNVEAPERSLVALDLGLLLLDRSILIALRATPQLRCGFNRG